MKSIDAEIFEVEQRLSTRKAALGRTASETKQRALQAMVSPVALVGAVALGFVVAGGIARRKARGPGVSEQTKEQSKGFALGTLLMTGATWFVRSQFGGPVGLAQFVLSKLRGSRSAATAEPAQIPR